MGTREDRHLCLLGVPSNIYIAEIYSILLKDMHAIYFQSFVFNYELNKMTEPPFP